MSVNNKRGRPFRDADNPIRKDVKIRVTDRMFEELNAYSQKHNMTIAEIIRRAITAFFENK